MSGAIVATAINPALKGPEMQVDTSAILNVVLTNKTGADIQITSTPASTIQIFMTPPTFFTAEQLATAKISKIGWSFSSGAPRNALALTATQDQTWADGDTLTFSIDDVTSSAKPGSYRASFVMLDFGDMPNTTAFAPLSLNAKPQPGDADLSKVLQISLDNRGSIYRSEHGDPLKNTLNLNIKNSSTTPLYTGSDLLPQGEVHVNFIYGNTSGALAPASGGGSQHPIGSAWNIRAQTFVAPVNWSITNPDTGQPEPEWTLSPGDPMVLGTGAKANVTFAFSDIIAFTPVGHTQMLVQFVGFRKDDTTRYSDHLFVLDISKQDPPPTRGLLAFSGVNPVTRVTHAKTPLDIELRWTMFDVARVLAITNIPGQLPIPVDYPAPERFANDKMTITVPSVARSSTYIINLQAIDGNGGFLNALQFAAFAEAAFVTDKAGQSYATAQFGNTFWMVEDYTLMVEGAQKGQAKGSVLYSWEAASNAANAPDGWRLPTTADWLALANPFPKQDQFTALQTGGSSGFNATLSGQYNSTGGSGFGETGAYWSSTLKESAVFLAASKTFMSNLSQPTNSISVRYVRDV